ncbi:alpha/beta hydrolase [Methylobacterium trifolii]|uniref:Alpha/beta hydrolase n=1 Tax=Methylobacterium trifolii TaxID=1003092 RepID=A0ABQ4U731_9HYPH|nr:alpha/beta hydrolase [Methylobacterium trifolii]GJE62601.1 hypothetical protein MPOCJGCO_4734 [Methylobacterium trifolii]
MRLPLAYTPPDLQESDPGPVRRRHVFFVPGYDPEARTRYRLLFVRELMRHAKRFGEGRRTVSAAALSPDGLVQGWNVAAHPPSGGAATRYEVLLWDDIVARDYARSRVLSVALLVVGTLHALAWGALWRFYRYNHRYGNVILYPFAMVVALTLVSVLIGTMVHAHLGDWFGYSLGLPAWASLPLGVAAGLVWLVGIEAFLNRLFFWQLLNTWVFNWQHGQLWRPDFEARVDAFADHVIAEIAGLQGEAPDEVMIVGHSVGALAAVELAARVLARAPALWEGRTRLSLVTLGSALPLVAVQPLARRLRAEIASLVTARRLVWCDFQTMQDWMNFPGFNPVLDLKLGLGARAVANPVVRSTQLKQVVEPETYAKILYRPFRLHFQCLLANERPGDYDFFRLTLGPQHLRDRALTPIVGPEPVAAAPEPRGG